jgi:hypothetical protein
MAEPNHILLREDIMHFLLRISYIFLCALFLEVVLPSKGHAITIFVDGMNSDITVGDLAGGSYDRKG